MSRMRVLLIEDNDADAGLIQRALSHGRDSGIDLTRVSEFSAGITAFRAQPFDVVLLDLQLPDCRDLETLRRFLLDFPQASIVVLTGRNDEQTAVLAVQQGAQDYLTKGRFEPEMLRRTIRYAFERALHQQTLAGMNSELERRIDERTSELERLQQSWRTQQEQLAHVDRLNTLGEMAAGLAHELNQPLMAIMGFAGAAQQLLHRNDFNQTEVAAIVREIASQAAHAGEVIRRLRSMIRSPDRQPRPCDLNLVVVEALELLHRDLSDNGVRVQSQMAQTLPQITLDAVQIQQVVINLVRNAVQAMASQPQDLRELGVRTWLSPERDVCVVEIADVGPGISPQHGGRLFDPFFTTKPEGLGLGLPISRKIMRHHGGQLELVRSGREGTVFHLTLPVGSSK